MILIFIVVVSCNENKPKTIEFRIDDNKFKVSEFNISDIHTTKHILKIQKIYGIFTDIAVKDSLLVCGNLYDPKLLNLYSLNNEKLLNQIIKRGTSTKEGLSASNFYLQNNIGNSSLWIYDITLGKLFKTELSKVIKDSSLVPHKEISLKSSLKNLIAPQIITDNLILATSYSLDDCRYFYTEGSKILKKVGLLPNVTNNIKLKNISKTKIPNKAYIFKAFSIKNPNSNQIAVFYNKTDRAEFYDNDQLYKVWNSTNNFNPVMQVAKLNDGYVVQDSDKTKYAYLSITSDEKYIYALYAGNEENKTSSDIILVFDWSGNSVKKISLDRKVCKIALEPHKRIVYCYDDVTKNIFSTQL